MGRRARGITFSTEEWQQVVDLAALLGLAKTETIRYAVKFALAEKLAEQALNGKADEDSRVD